MDADRHAVDRAHPGEVDEAGARGERPVQAVPGRTRHFAPADHAPAGEPAGRLDVLGEADEVVGGTERRPSEHERAAALDTSDDALPFEDVHRPHDGAPADLELAGQIVFGFDLLAGHAALCGDALGQDPGDLRSSAAQLTSQADKLSWRQSGIEATGGGVAKHVAWSRQLTGGGNA